MMIGTVVVVVVEVEIVVVVVVVAVAPILVRTSYMKVVTKVVPNMSRNENLWLPATSDCLFVSSVHPRGQTNLAFSTRTSQHSPDLALHIKGPTHISSDTIERPTIKYC